MSGPAELDIRLARPEEREALEELQRRASLALDEYHEQLEAEPDAVQLPTEQIESGEVIVAELDDRIAGFAAVSIDEFDAELDGLFVEPDLVAARNWGGVDRRRGPRGTPARPGDDRHRQSVGAGIL